MSATTIIRMHLFKLQGATAIQAYDYNGQDTTFQVVLWGLTLANSLGKGCEEADFMGVRLGSLLIVPESKWASSGGRKCLDPTVSMASLSPSLGSPQASPLCPDQGQGFGPGSLLTVCEIKSKATL